MAKSIVAGVATEKAAPRLVRHCAKCGEQELFCWCGVERQREVLLSELMHEYGRGNVRTRADGAVFANGVLICFSEEVKALSGGAA
jgi:hypothetical protein